MTTIRRSTLATCAALALPAALRAQDAPRATAVDAVSAGDPAPAPALLHACYIQKSGTVYRIKVPGSPDKCHAGHVEFSWNQQGVQGQTGPQGPAGPQGPQGPAGVNGPASGDVSGTYPTLTVAGLQGRALAATAPTDGQLLGWNAAQSRWEPKAAPAGGGAFTLPYAGTATSALNTSLFKVTQQGAGVSGEFLGTGGGVALRASSLGGVGVYGLSSLGGAASAGVRAEHALEQGTALEIARGAIRVTGAGLNTNTAVFWSRLSDLSPDPGGIDGTYVLTIDHLLANGDPNAIVTVTPRLTSTTYFWGFTPERLAVRYNGAKGRWEIVVQYDDSTVPQSKAFNISIVKP